MSVIRPSNISQTPLSPARVAPNDALKAAQRAFFHAALTGTPVPAPVAAQPARAASAVKSEEPAPQDRFPRPGSLVDIRV